MSKQTITGPTLFSNHRLDVYPEYDGNHLKLVFHFKKESYYVRVGEWDFYHLLSFFQLITENVKNKLSYGHKFTLNQSVNKYIHFKVMGLMKEGRALLVIAPSDSTFEKEYAIAWISKDEFGYFFHIINFLKNLWYLVKVQLNDFFRKQSSVVNTLENFQTNLKIDFVVAKQNKMIQDIQTFIPSNTDVKVQQQSPNIFTKLEVISKHMKAVDKIPKLIFLAAKLYQDENAFTIDELANLFEKFFLGKKPDQPEEYASFVNPIKKALISAYKYLKRNWLFVEQEISSKRNPLTYFQNIEGLTSLEKVLLVRLYDDLQTLKNEYKKP